MPNAEIEILDIRKGFVLNDQTALHLRAQKDFTDFYGKKRLAGEQWLVDKTVTDVHILDAQEDLVQEIKIKVLQQNQMCEIKNPVDKKGKPQYGKKEIRRGECKFFLQPGELMPGGIKNIIVIHEEEALLLRARVPYFDKRTKKEYKPGQKWLIRGPIDFIPENEVEVIEKRQAYPLAENEGIYVRDLWSGQVKLVRGPQTYLLNEYEELWEKELQPQIEYLIGLNLAGVDYTDAKNRNINLPPR